MFANNIEHKDVGSKSLEVNVNMGVAKSGKCSIALGVVPVQLRGQGCELVVNALLNSGSDATLINERILNRLHLLGVQKSLSITTLNGEHRLKSNRVTFEIGAVNSTKVHKIDAWSVDHLPEFAKLAPTQNQCQK